MPRKAFDRANEEREEAGEPLFANPRNACSGSLKLQDPREVARDSLTLFSMPYLPGRGRPRSRLTTKVWNSSERSASR